MSYKKQMSTKRYKKRQEPYKLSFELIHRPSKERNPEVVLYIQCNIGKQLKRATKWKLNKTLWNDAISYDEGEKSFIIGGMRGVRIKSLDRKKDEVKEDTKGRNLNTKIIPRLNYELRRLHKKYRDEFDRMYIIK